MTIPELIEKLEKATAPDRELDADIAITLKMIAEREWWSVNYLSGDMIPAYTASIDAAVHLCERVLPGWRNSSIKSGDNEFAAYIWADSNPWPPEASVERVKSSRAIALCIAIFRALQPKEGE